MRAALIDGEAVVNVIEYDPDADYDPGEGIVLVELADEPVGPGWRRRGGVFVEPPVETLEVIDGVAPLATYRNTFDDAPPSVMFDVNGATATVALTDGVAELEITPPATGSVTVSVNRPDVQPVTIRGE